MSSDKAIQRFTLRQISLCVGLACSSMAVWAQTADPVVAQASTGGAFKEVVVSGSRVEQDIDEVPATITTINAQEIARENPTDLEDLLRGEVGVSVRALPNRTSAVFSAVGRAGNEGVNIRGMEGDQVRLQVDGVSLPATYSSGPYSAGRGDMIDPEGYKRVEILRGASSTQYGSDGLAGAVSFVTKDPSDLLTLGKPTQFNFKTGYSSVDNSWQVAPSFAFKGEGVQGLVLASMRRGHESENMGQNTSANLYRTAPNPSDTQSDYLLAKLLFNSNVTHQFKLTAETIRRENNTDVLTFFGDPVAAATLTDVTVREVIKRQMAKLDYRYAPTQSWFDVLTATLYTQDTENRQFGSETRSAAPLIRTRDTLYGENTVGTGVQLESNFGKSVTHRLVYGVDLVRSEVTSMKDGYNSNGTAAFVPNKSFPDTDYQTLSGFVQDDIGIGALTVTPGLRYDSFKLTPKPDALYRVNNTTEPSSLSGSELSPRLGAVWKLAPLVQPFAQYAHGFRAPKPSQVNGGVTNLTAVPPYRSIGNPDLKPEISDTIELGLRGRDATRRYSASVFRGEYKNFIESDARVYTSPAPSPTDPNINQSVNRGQVVISGFELRGDWAFVKNWNASAAYAHTKGDSYSGGTVAPLATIDPDKIILGLRYDQGALWGVGTRLTAVDRKDRKHDETVVTPGGYTVVDLSGWYSFSKATTLSVGVRNLFDKKYVEWADVRGVATTSSIVDAYTQPGRNFAVSVTHSF